MKHVPARVAAASLAALLAAGCSAQGDFPSLAPRQIELGNTQPTATTTPPPVLTSNPQLLSRLSSAVKLAESGVSAFDSALAAARMASNASDGVRGSERWVAAQMALSQLERTRSPAATAMADLDDARRTLLMGGPSGDLAAVETAWAKVQDIYQGQMEASQAVAAAANRR